MKRSRTRLACWLGAALAALAIGCGSEQDKAVEHLARAEAYQAEGKQKEALIELRSALQRDPRNAEVNYRIGRLLEQQQEVGDAAFYFGEAHRLDPSRTDAMLAQAQLLSFVESERAADLVEQVLQREPDNAEAYVAKSHLALVQKDIDQARTAAFTATELDPKSASAFLQLGIVYQAQIRQLRDIEGKEADDQLYRSAIQAFERAAKLGDPAHNVTALRERGRTFASWPGHEAEADAAFRELVAYTETLDDARLRRRGPIVALTYARRAGRPEMHRWALERLIEVEPDDVGAWTELAYVRQATDGGGREVLSKLIEARPRDAAAHVAYARLLSTAESRQAAIEHLQRIESEVDDRPVVLGFLVDLHYGADDDEAAAQVVERLEREFPNSDRTMLARAQQMIVARRLDEAGELLREFNGRTESADGQRLLAMVEYRRGRFSEAAQAIDRALALSPAPEPVIYQLRARIMYANRRWPELLQTVGTLARTQGGPPSPRLRTMRVEALYELGRTQLANHALETELSLTPPRKEAVLLFARYRGRENPERARELLQGAIERAPDDLRLTSALAQLDVVAGRHEQALALLDQTLASGVPDERAAGLRLLRAQVLLDLGRLDDARADALRAFQADPANPQAVNVLVAIYTEQGRLEEAVESLAEAREVGALGPQGEELLARLYGQIGRDDDAIALYEQLLQRGAGNVAGVKNDLAYLLAERGRDLDRALELARQAQAEIGEFPSVADTLGFVYYRKQLYGPALEQFRFAIEAAERPPAQPGAATAGYHYHKALALVGLERHDEAIEALKTALARDPDLAEAKQALAELEARQDAAAPSSQGPS